MINRATATRTRWIQDSLHYDSPYKDYIATVTCQWNSAYQEVEFRCFLKEDPFNGTYPGIAKDWITMKVAVEVLRSDTFMDDVSPLMAEMESKIEEYLYPIVFRKQLEEELLKP